MRTIESDLATGNDTRLDRVAFVATAEDMIVTKLGWGLGLEIPGEDSRLSNP